MKTINLFLIVFSFFTLLILCMSTTTEAGDPSFSSETMEEFFAPDFRISNIATPGGLCKGNESKVRVTVTNSAIAGYRHDIPVTLVVSEPGRKTQTYWGKIRNGFAGKDNKGQAVWFNNVLINDYKDVTLHAKVNEDKSIEETNYGNNDKKIKAKASHACGAPSATAQPGKRLSVRVLDSPNSSPRTGLQVELRKGSIVRNGNTGNTGTAQIDDVPSGSYSLIVKQGTAVIEDRTYVMPNYNASLNIILD
jgi:hypothetical protein